MATLKSEKFPLGQQGAEGKFQEEKKVKLLEKITLMPKARMFPNANMKLALPKNLTVAMAIEKYFASFPFGTYPWRRAKARSVKLNFTPLLGKDLVCDLTYGDFRNFQKTRYTRGLIETFFHMLRFVCEGELRSFEMPPTSDTIRIKPLAMTLADALSKMKNSRTRFGELILGLLEELKNLPKGTPYPFEPIGRNLDDKTLVSMRNEITKAFKNEKHPYVLRFLKKEKQFIIFHQADLHDAWNNPKRRNKK